VTTEAESLKERVLQGPRPVHVGIIMDGNGRWAESRGLPRLEGHRAGAESVRAITTAAREVGIQALTLYAFSTQNWGRPRREVLGLMNLLRSFLLQEKSTLIENDIRLRSIGEIDRLPGRVRRALEEVQEASAGGRSMTLTLALSYGGQEEIVHAARALARQASAGTLDPEDVDVRAFQRALWSGSLPPLDLCIRTSGEHRVSNFLLWHLAYAEIVVSSELWPDFREEAFFSALLEYRRRERRFGLTGAQIRERST
jgi:undecaprenyl diphosphate synthase